MKKNKLIAVIDIGSHSIRLFIGYIQRKGSFKEIEKLWVPIPIGLDTFTTGVVSNPTILNMINVIKNFKKVIDSYDVDYCKAVATSSIREASNSDILIERVLHLTGLKIEIIEPMQETWILYNGVRRIMKDRYGFLKEMVLLFSMGGGSTQYVLQNNGNIIFSETHNQGTLRLLKNLELPMKYLRFSLKPLSFNFAQTIQRYCDVRKVERLIALNDDVLHVISKLAPETEAQSVYRITKKHFSDIYKKIDAMSIDEMKDEFEINEQVAGTTRVAFIMLEMFYAMTGAKEVLFPNVTMSQSVLMGLSMGSDVTSLAELDEAAVSNVISASLHIGRKFQFDEKHAVHVRKLAVKLFDEMREHYGFAPKERLYLEVAALLHDVGTFVSSSNHHKYSMEMIAASEIMGLDKEEIFIISQIARYHRKAMPKGSHIEYTSLPTDQRLQISRIASLLRVADALDGTHTQWVEDIRFDMLDDHGELYLKMAEEGYEYLDIVKQAVRKKADLFESFYGVPIKVERML